MTEPRRAFNFFFFLGSAKPFAPSASTTMAGLSKSEFFSPGKENGTGSGAADTGRLLPPASFTCDDAAAAAASGSSSSSEGTGGGTKSTFLGGERGARNLDRVPGVKIFAPSGTGKGCSLFTPLPAWCSLEGGPGSCPAFAASGRGVFRAARSVDTGGGGGGSMSAPDAAAEEEKSVGTGGGAAAAAAAKDDADDGAGGVVRTGVSSFSAVTLLAEDSPGMKIFIGTGGGTSAADVCFSAFPCWTSAPDTRDFLFPLTLSSANEDEEIEEVEMMEGLNKLEEALDGERPHEGFTACVLGCCPSALGGGGPSSSSSSSASSFACCGGGMVWLGVAAVLVAAADVWIWVGGGGRASECWRSREGGRASRVEEEDEMRGGARRKREGKREEEEEEEEEEGSGGGNILT
eukprot:gb/GEZN01005749.1/.p1 GENE.gb/GEZN01005749.1/~~gb/GEZN01005749.1/.p1  ORF type:complete len:405 (+),score=107.66 gb/GEZN01005749.1/:419-1633(+)